MLPLLYSAIMKTHIKTETPGKCSRHRGLFTCLPLLLSVALVGCGGKQEEHVVEAPQAVEQQAKPEVQATSSVAPIPETEVQKADVAISDTVPDAEPENIEQKQPDAAEPFVLEDLEHVKVYEGIDGPKVGDTIYTFQNLPKDACGTYWVLDSSGYVSMLAVCSGDHAH